MLHILMQYVSTVVRGLSVPSVWMIGITIQAVPAHIYPAAVVLSAFIVPLLWSGAAPASKITEPMAHMIAIGFILPVAEGKYGPVLRMLPSAEIGKYNKRRFSFHETL